MLKKGRKKTYGFCAYHELECDYGGVCIRCPHNTKEDIEWFKKDIEQIIPKAERKIEDGN